MALLVRFIRTCRRRPGSPTTLRGASGAKRTINSNSFSAALLAPFGILRQTRFLTQRGGQLKNLRHVKWLFENDQLIRCAQTLCHLIPAVVGVCRANHYLEIRIDLPDSARRFDAIPARRHAY